MVLNYIWIAFFLIAFVVAMGRLVFGGDTTVFTEIINSSFSTAKTAFEISLGLTGILSLWLGIMKIGERGGVIQAFARWAAPVFSKLFPEIPKDHPVTGSIFMNLSANLLGLDNAATPMGLKAMQQLQELNPDKEQASNSMVMFLCINASGLTLIPISIMMYRAQLGAANPSDVFLPIMLTTFTSTLVAILAVCFRQGIRIWQRNLLLFFGSMGLLIGGLILLFQSMEQEQVSLYSTVFANTLLFTIMCGFIWSGVRKRINVYDAFIEGAKEGFQTAITIIPYLVAILVAIGVFRASGAMDRWRKIQLVGRRAVHRFCRGVAHDAHEAAQWQRIAGNDARRNEHLWCRFVYRPLGRYRARLLRHDLLCRCPLLWQRRRAQHTLHGAVCLAGRFRGRTRGHRDGLPLLLIPHGYK